MLQVYVALLKRLDWHVFEHAFLENFRKQNDARLQTEEFELIIKSKAHCRIFCRCCLTVSWSHLQKKTLNKPDEELYT